MVALCGWQPACIGVLASVQDSALPSLALPPLSHGLSSQEAGASVEADPLDAGIGYRALPAASFFLRIFIIWAISSWFRRGPSPQDQSGPGGAPRVASRNLFPKDTLMVMLDGKELEGWESGVLRASRMGHFLTALSSVDTWDSDALPHQCV